MGAGIIFEQGLIRATFLVVHTFAHLAHCGWQKNERLLDFRVKKRSHFYTIWYGQLNVTEEASKYWISLANNWEFSADVVGEIIIKECDLGRYSYFNPRSEVLNLTWGVHDNPQRSLIGWIISLSIASWVQRFRVLNKDGKMAYFGFNRVKVFDSAEHVEDDSHVPTHF